MNYIVGWTRVEVATKDDKVRVGVVHPTNQLFHLVRRELLVPSILFFSTISLSIFSDNMSLIKMAIILPTGQWYAPSAVNNDA